MAYTGDDSKNPHWELSVAQIPNLLSGVRLAMIPLLLLLAWHAETAWFLTLFALGLATDVLDGVVARRLDVESEFGARLDQWADFALWLAFALGAWWVWPTVLRREAPFVVVSIASLLVPTAIAYLKYREIPGYHTWTAKLCSVLMGLAVPALLLFDASWPFRLATVGMLVAGIDQLGITALLRECHHDVPSIFHAARLRNQAGVT